MDINEVNKVIAEFMEWEEHPVPDYDEHNFIYRNHNNEFVYDIEFTNSLDALVPVWEKLQEEAKKIDDPDGLLDFEFSICDYSGTSGLYIESNWGRIDVSGHNKTIQEAAARTTAKAIMELGE